jgi:hypothetical protein
MDLNKIPRQDECQKHPLKILITKQIILISQKHLIFLQL